MKKLNELINKLECYPLTISHSILSVSTIIVEKNDLEDAIYYLKKYNSLLNKTPKCFIVVYKYIEYINKNIKKIKKNINENIE